VGPQPRSTTTTTEGQTPVTNNPPFPTNPPYNAEWDSDLGELVAPSTTYMSSNLPAPEHNHDDAGMRPDDCARCEIEAGNRALLEALLASTGPEWLVRAIDELAGFPDNGMVPPATISQSAHENDEELTPEQLAGFVELGEQGDGSYSLAQQVAARISPASLLGLDEYEADHDADHERHITAERHKLELGLDRAIDGIGLASEAHVELAGPAYDVEFAEGNAGPDMRAHLDRAALELRAALRIVEAVDR
jgi:hypothetical protein